MRNMFVVSFRERHFCLMATTTTTPATKIVCVRPSLLNFEQCVEIANKTCHKLYVPVAMPLRLSLCLTHSRSSAAAAVAAAAVYQVY